MTSLNRFFTVFFGFLVCLPAVLFAAEDQYNLSDSRIATINGIIAKSVADKEDLTNSAVIQSIYDRISAEMPLSPKKPIVQVDLKELNARAYEEAQKKFKTHSGALKEEYAAEAAEKYPMNKLRDKVTVVYKRGVVTGTLYKINASSILVNNTTISFIDMDRQTRSRFDAQFNKDLRARYIQSRCNEFHLEFAKYQQSIFEELLTTAKGENEQNGYIYLKRREIWKTAKEIAAAELEPEIERYKTYKEKQERIRRKREAKEKAAREAREKAEAEAKAAEQKQKENEADGTGGQSALAQNSTGALPVAPDEGKMAENIDPQDIFNTESASGTPQTDEGGNFIALTPEQLAALSRPRVNETTYKALMAKIEEKQEEINSKYFGIDADQGFKKALWGFSATEVYYALSKETDAAFIKPSINIDYIIYPEGSRPQKIYLHYYFGQLYRVETFLGNLKQSEFNIYKNSLQQKYGESDTQRKMGDDVFLRLAEGTLSPNDLPPYVEASPEEKAENAVQQNAADPTNGKNENSGGGASAEADSQTRASNKYFIFVWEGKLSRGVLSFLYDPQTQIYSSVVFEKIYLPLRLKKIEEKQAAEKQRKESAEAPAPAEETKKEK